MGDSRGHWDGDTLVVDVGNINDKTWFDMAGDFHSDALHVVERYRMTGHDTIQYEATIEDAKVFTKPWTINIALHRRMDRDRLFEYACRSRSRRGERRVHARGANLVSGQPERASRSTMAPHRACAARLRRSRAPTSAGRRTASRTCRASMNPRPEARTRAWKDAPRPA